MMQARGAPIPPERGEGGSSSALDVDEQERLLLLQQDILKAVARGADTMSIINEVCRLEERLLPGSVASVMLLDAAGEYLSLYAAPSMPEAGRARLDRLRPGPGAGSCGNAVHRGEPQYVGNTLTDTRWHDLRQIAIDFNLCACWSAPVFSGPGEIIGSFALSSFEPREPTAFHRRMLETGASIIGIVLERGRVQASLRLFETAYHGSAEGIIITDLQQRILSVNRAFAAPRGYAPEELVGQTPRVFASGLHDPAFYAQMWQQLERSGHWSGEVWNRRKDGEVRPDWLTISCVRDPAGTRTHFIGLYHDISERKTAEARIRHLASHDPLTDLPNRMLLRDRLELAVLEAGQTGGRVALLVLDLDHFKLLNDSLGHGAGDALLRTIAARLNECVRPGDTVSRQGGDEFLLVLPGRPDAEAIGLVAQVVLDAVARPIEVGGSPLTLTGSIGVAVYPEDGSDAETLLKRADKAMYSAKQGGRNTWRFFSARMTSDSFEYLRLAHQLREGLQRGEFELHYQPQLDLASGRLMGAEALIRWNHPEEGRLAPGRFIGVAEQSGLIVQIGAWALREACLQARAWQREGLPALMVAVNVSAVQFSSADLACVIDAALDESGLDGRWLELELTESVLFDDEARLLEQLGRIKRRGVRLAIDDFGTGYSSLSYLKKFKADRLKIDRTFVRDMRTDPDGAAIVCAVVQMAGALNLRSVAEGVETAEQQELLRTFGCDEIQGYHLARPMSAPAFSRFVRAWESGRETGRPRSRAPV